MNEKYKVMNCELCGAQMVVPADRRPFPCMQCTCSLVSVALFEAFMQEVTQSDAIQQYWLEAPLPNLRERLR